VIVMHRTLHLSLCHLHQRRRRQVGRLENTKAAGRHRLRVKQSRRRHHLAIPSDRIIQCNAQQWCAPGDSGLRAINTHKPRTPLFNPKCTFSFFFHSQIFTAENNYTAESRKSNITFFYINRLSNINILEYIFCCYFCFL
jgi:hypothetical protein